MLRLLIVDDHPMTCIGLESLLRSCYPDARIDTRHEATGLSEVGADYDYVFLDMHLPGIRFSELLENLYSMSVRLVLISANPEPELVERARALGVRGLLLKNANTAQLLDGFRRIQAGERVFAEARSLFGAPVLPEALSTRQKDVYEALLGGLSNKQIARKLGIAESTVKEHVTSVLAHFGVRNRMDLLLQQKRPPVV